MTPSPVRRFTFAHLTTEARAPHFPPTSELGAVAAPPPSSSGSCDTWAARPSGRRRAKVAPRGHPPGGRSACSVTRRTTGERRRAGHSLMARLDVTIRLAEDPSSDAGGRTGPRGARSGLCRGSTPLSTPLHSTPRTTRTKAGRPAGYSDDRLTSCDD